MKLTLGFSPCPNDTFIFDALVNNKIDTRGLSFEVMLEDVETLNQWALNGKLDITKLSYGTLPLVMDKYAVLNSGSALGKAVGPLLISKEEAIQDVEGSVIAIPGEHTTAHVLFSLAYPGAKNKIFMRYDKIEDFVIAGNGLGVIIHENRFTFEDKGLHRITDLGEYWEKETANPIPLGGITIKRLIEDEIKFKVDELIKASIEYAYEHHYKELTEYVKVHSQEMSESIMRKHIDLYVNHHSINLGDEGKNAIKKFIDIYQSTHTDIKISIEGLFV